MLTIKLINQQLELIDKELAISVGCLTISSVPRAWELLTVKTILLQELVNLIKQQYPKEDLYE